MSAQNEVRLLIVFILAIVCSRGVSIESLHWTRDFDNFAMGLNMPASSPGTLILFEVSVNVLNQLIQ